MMNETDPNKSPFGWKMIIGSAITSIIFLAIIYLAMTNEPDYMPSQQKKIAAEQAQAATEASQAASEMDHSMHNMSHAHTASEATP